MKSNQYMFCLTPTTSVNIILLWIADDIDINTYVNSPPLSSMLIILLSTYRFISTTLPSAISLFYGAMKTNYYNLSLQCSRNRLTKSKSLAALPSTYQYTCTWKIATGQRKYGWDTVCRSRITTRVARSLGVFITTLRIPRSSCVKPWWVAAGRWWRGAARPRAASSCWSCCPTAPTTRRRRTGPRSPASASSSNPYPANTDPKNELNPTYLKRFAQSAVTRFM